MRALFEISAEETLIFSRTGQDLRLQFPELCRLHEVLPPCVLDGEIVALTPGDADREDLELLQMRLGDKKARRMAEIPVSVRFFDVLEISGIDVRSLPLFKRRERLEDLVGPDFLVELHDSELPVPAHWEGTIAKDPLVAYLSGKRSVTWTKFKFVERATLRVTGLTAGKNARAASFGAAVVEDANGVCRGQVGSGFNAESIAEMMEFSAAIEQGSGPLIEVEYRFLSKTGLMVNTSFKGFRPDKSEADSL
jgi:ATP-dependent DNA ligase